MRPQKNKLSLLGGLQFWSFNARSRGGVPNRIDKNRAKAFNSLMLTSLVIAALAVTSAMGAAFSCDEQGQKKMQTQYSDCLNKHTLKHHEETTKSKSSEELQNLTCQLIRDTIECGGLYSACHSAEEVRTIKDTHIVARISQYADNRDGINVDDCDVVKEYLESGRADEKADSKEKCTFAQVNKAQTDFSSCSTRHSSDAWDRIDTLKEKHKDSGEDVVETKIRPMFCEVLSVIASDCSVHFESCFNTQDIEQMKAQHINQLKSYFGNLITGLNLEDCQTEEPEDSLDDYSYISDYGDGWNDDDEDKDYVETNEILGPSSTTSTEASTSTSDPSTSSSTESPADDPPAPESASSYSAPPEEIDTSMPNPVKRDEKGGGSPPAEAAVVENGTGRTNFPAFNLSLLLTAIFLVLLR